MKIGINLVGVSYNNAIGGGRLRNYEDAIDNFYKYIVEPFQKNGHEVEFYLYSYENEKQEKIVFDYYPCKKSKFVRPEYNKLGGGDRIPEGYKVMSISYLNSLHQLKNEDLDLVISTRYDIKFLKNPFEEYNFDFDKMNFLWREPEFMDLPIVNDTFLVFPYQSFLKHQYLLLQELFLVRIDFYKLQSIYQRISTICHLPSNQENQILFWV